MYTRYNLRNIKIVIFLFFLSSVKSLKNYQNNSLFLPQKESESLDSDNSESEYSRFVTFVENLLLLQSVVSNKAGLETREKFAKISRKWADVAEFISHQKRKEVIILTKKAQEAQTFALILGSISTSLQQSALIAQQNYISAIQLYKSLTYAKESAELNLKRISAALSLFEDIEMVREKWALEERERASRLTSFLQIVLFELKKSSEYYEEAHQAATSFQNQPFLHF